MTYETVRNHALFLPAFDTTRFNAVIWSLVHEMRISLAFPLLAICVVRLRWGWCLAAALALSAFGCFGYQLHWRLGFLRTSYGLSLHYAAFFVLGAVAAKHRHWVAQRLATASLRLRLSVAALGLALYSAESLYPPGRTGGLVAQQVAVACQSFEWIAAFGSVLLVASAPTAVWLRLRPCVWLGRVSYSLYLWHLPVSLATYHLGYGLMPVWCLTLLAVAFGLVVAEVAYILVEGPSLRLAKRIGRPAQAESIGPRTNTATDPVGPSTS